MKVKFFNQTKNQHEKTSKKNRTLTKLFVFSQQKPGKTT